MQQKTSSTQFQRYGSVYETPIDCIQTNQICRDWHIKAERNVSQLLRFDCEVNIEMEDGLAAILVSESGTGKDLERFAVHRFVRLKPNIAFALVAITAEIDCKLITHVDFSSTVLPLSPVYDFDRILPNIYITQILGYYYSIRNANYFFKGEAHEFFELTYVDRGGLLTQVDGVSYELHENDLMIYGANQFHTQRMIDAGEHGSNSCSYITILFDIGSVDSSALLNRVFSCDKRLYTLIRTFVQEGSSQLPYMNSLMLCLLQEIIIRLLQNDFIEKAGKGEEKLSNNIRQHYQDVLLEKILSYIDETICQPITIADICQKFSLSRSSLQLLFKENLNQSPKKYISERKLDKACRMIDEGTYNISEIALMMGFNSIHYFSRAFTQRYHMSPSEYSKTIFRD